MEEFYKLLNNGIHVKYENIPEVYVFAFSMFNDSQLLRPLVDHLKERGLTYGEIIIKYKKFGVDKNYLNYHFNKFKKEKKNEDEKQ